MSSGCFAHSLEMWKAVEHTMRGMPGDEMFRMQNLERNCRPWRRGFGRCERREITEKGKAIAQKRRMVVQDQYKEHFRGSPTR